jgi:Fe-S cluster assembly protein SufB
MIKIEDITKEIIDEQGKRLHEPRWLREERMKSLEQFQSADEMNWKKSKTPKLDFASTAQLSFSEEVSPLKIKEKVPEGSSGKITMHDGKVLRISLKKELAHQGVIFCDMQTAVLERADLLELHCKESNWGLEDKLSFFQRTFWDNGVFLWIPAGVNVEEPFQIQIVQTKKEKSIMNRNVFITEKGASAIVEELYESLENDEERILCSTVTEIFAQEASHIKYFSNQNWPDNIYDLSLRRYNAEKSAKITTLLSLLGAKEGRIAVTGNPSQESAHVQHDGILVGREKQSFKIIAEMEHTQQHSEGLMRYKGILKDEAYSDLDGLIRVRPHGQFTHSRLEEHTLLLSDKARCDALPALDIQTDNVQVSHAAAVTQADQERMFYLMSRGLNEDEARALLVEGFFEDLLSLISRPEWYDFTKSLIESKVLSSSDTVLND